VRIGIFGRGRLGNAVAALAAKDKALELAWIVDLGEKPSGEVDAALDASAAGAVGGHLSWALETGTALVIAATGWDEAVLAPAKAAPPKIGVMVSPNFSLSVAFMRRAALALGRFAALDPDSALGIVEHHHAAKADAPSGTAKLLAGALAQGCPRYSGWNMGRAEPGKINVASLRIGTEVGYHEIFYETAFDRMLLSHQALSRETFGAGALAALKWMPGRKGLYSFDDLAAELIAPLFRE
jgi:4-hydroxy-tetrahydrodipicolinate reductase